MRITFSIALAALAATSASAQAFNWTLENPATKPLQRERTATGTDGTVYYMYGGQNGSSVAGRDELWSYDGTNWTLLTASGASCGVRAGAIGAYDIARGKFVVFGGVTGFSGTTNFRLDDTWEWDSVNGWVQATPATVPAGRWLTTGIYVPGKGVVFHGGNIWNGGAPTQSNETWAFDGTDWTLLSNAGPASQLGALVYRSVQGDVILHSGVGASAGQTWRFDVNTDTWTQLFPATTPFSNHNANMEALQAAMAYYNPNSCNMIVHGGNGGNSSTKTWQFDGTDWSDISTNGVGCRNGGMEWIAALDKAVYGPCNEQNGTRDRTRSHGPSVVGTVVVNGAGCVGQGGLLTLVENKTPWTASTWSATCSNVGAAALTLDVFGFAAASLQLDTVLPFALPGCFLFNTADVIPSAGLPIGGQTTMSLSFPPTPALAGTQLHAQSIELDFGASTLAASNGLILTIGG